MAINVSLTEKNRVKLSPGELEPTYFKCALDVTIKIQILKMCK